MRECRDVHGILLLDKPRGITSNAALQMAKRLFKARKAGHSGSLDPIARGLLPICFGEATKFSRFLLEADKYYQTTMMLGIRTDSGDSEGKILSQCTPPIYSLAHLEKILQQFRGYILQIPSMYSAIKYQGQPLYKLARQGIEIERPARPVSVHLLKIVERENNFLSLDIHVSKGTYIRTLVDDIGKALGCGAHVVELRRIRAGAYRAEQMVSFESLEQTVNQGGMEKLDEYLLPLDSSVVDMPDLALSEVAAFYLCQGQPVIVPYAPTSGWVRLSQGKHFLGVGEILEDGRVAPRRLTQKVVSL